MSQNVPSSDFAEKTENRRSLPLFKWLIVPMLLVVVGGLGFFAVAQQHSAAHAAAATSGCGNQTASYRYADVNGNYALSNTIKTHWCWNGATITSRSWVYSWSATRGATFVKYVNNNPSQCTFTNGNATGCRENSDIVFRFPTYGTCIQSNVQQVVDDKGRSAQHFSGDIPYNC